MTLAQSLYRQFEKPQGLLGRLAGAIMAKRGSNVERSLWTLHLLGIEPHHRVLEIGFGPGVAIARAAELAGGGEVVGLDHSALMVRQASKRNRAAIAAGRLHLHRGDLSRLPSLGRFDRIYSVNVAMFWPDRRAALAAIAASLKPGGRIATTYQPRARNAVARDGEVFAASVAADLHAIGLRNVRLERMVLKPLPAHCILGDAP